MKRRWAWNCLCDRCGFKYKMFQLKRTWDNLMVCNPCWESRHEQDLIKIPKDDQSIPWSRPEPEDTFIETTYVASDVGVQGPAVPEGNFTTNNGTL